ncbi:MAG: glycosyltransferase [Candidatus Aenigmarchaeota archaeon]|nr:glycosyltransferase [Candidatus Aenigmarchaeota archaeon]
MKIAWISSYYPRACGIATYSAEYVKELRRFENDITVISHTDAKPRYDVIPIIDDEDEKWHLKVYDAIKEIKPDVVHFQHEYGLYECKGDKNQRLIELLGLLKKGSIPAVMTFHSVYSTLDDCQSSFMNESLKLLPAGIVHCEYQKEALPHNLGWTPDNVYVLPHGAREGLKLDKEECKGLYRDKNIVGMVGLASQRKGFHRILERWHEICNDLEDCILMVDVMPHPKDIKSREYIAELARLTAESQIKIPGKKSIEYEITYPPNEDDLHKKLKSFDVVVLPYETESQSGILARSFATHTPSIVRDTEGLGFEVKKSRAGIAVKSDDEILCSIVDLIRDSMGREKMEDNARNYVNKYCGWSIVSKKTMQIYEDIKSFFL